jgi:phosphopantothenoylcysteine decarboxylase / phosphopantothenate---cysteine ligase
LARILITSGPTRQYLDPVRYLSNASSGQMGAALAEAALALGHEVVIVSGPVQIEYPAGAELIGVTSTEEMLTVAKERFARCDGVIGAAAPCDYRPVDVADHKLRKTGQPLTLTLVETPDVLATLGQGKGPEQWAVGFALETEDARFSALAKLERKSCDLMVLNGVTAINSSHNEVEIIASNGEMVHRASGDKLSVARQIMKLIQSRLIDVNR